MTTLNPPAVSYSSPGVKPLPLGPAVLFFAVPSLAVTISYYWGIPTMAELGLPEYLAYLVATGAPLFGLLIVALVAHSLASRGIIPLPASLPASLHPSLRVGGVAAYRELMGPGAAEHLAGDHHPWSTQCHEHVSLGADHI